MDKSFLALFSQFFQFPWINNRDESLSLISTFKDRSNTDAVKFDQSDGTKVRTL